MIIINFLIGYVRITDLGIARFWKLENSCDTSGTPGYMGIFLKKINKINFVFYLAPEVMCRQNHSFAVDYFAVGVIAYEFMLGRVININEIINHCDLL